MPNETDNHDFFLPDKNQDGWGDDKNGDWGDLDLLLKHIASDGSAIGTEADPLPSQHVESTSTGELSVNDNTTVTGGPIGDVGDYIPLWSARFGENRYTTTSTSYVRVSTSSNENITPYSSMAITNIESYHISWVGILLNTTDSGDVFAKLGGTGTTFDGTEVQSGGGFARHQSPIVPYQGEDESNLSIYMKVNSGTGEIRLPTAVMWGKVA